VKVALLHVRILLLHVVLHSNGKALDTSETTQRICCFLVFLVFLVFSLRLVRDRRATK
jgi:hypothetical protein